jgi:hypothetical protein
MKFIRNTLTLIHAGNQTDVTKLYKGFLSTPVLRSTVHKFTLYTETKKNNRSRKSSVGKVVQYKLMQNTPAHNLAQEVWKKESF